MKVQALFLFVICFIVPSLLLNGQGSIRANFDNDFPFGTDRYYTHSFELEILSRNLFDSGLKYLRPYKSDRSGFGAIAVSQKIYTPDNITDVDRQKGDRPYAGLLKADFISIPASSRSAPRIITGLTLGIVGPAAGAFEMQSAIHSLNKSVDNSPKGWKNQIDNAPYINIFAVLTSTGFSGKYGGVFFSTAATLGTGTISMESALISRFGNIKVVYSPTGEYLFLPPQKKSGFFGAVYSGIRGEAKFYDALLSGGITGESPYTLNFDEISKFIAKFDVGCFFAYNKIGIFAEYSLITPEFSGAEIHQFTEFGFSYTFNREKK